MERNEIQNKLFQESSVGSATYEAKIIEAIRNHLAVPFEDLELEIFNINQDFGKPQKVPGNKEIQRIFKKELSKICNFL